MGIDWKREWKPLAAIAVVFAVFFYLPLESLEFRNAVFEALALTKWYAQEHVILCLVPAFFIAGAIAVFVSNDSVMKYLGSRANKIVSYGVASVSGTVLAVCSCTVLPLFAGIHRMGAGLGPATAFLYAGPAINVLAIILTARVLGLELGIARAGGAILFSILLGLMMHFIFRKSESVRVEARGTHPEMQAARPLWQTILYFAAMIGILVFANWGSPDEPTGFWHAVYSQKWLITSGVAAALAVMLICWFGLPRLGVGVVALLTLLAALMMPDKPLLAFSVAIVGLSVITSGRNDRTGEWFGETWGFAKQILPLLLAGVLIAGLLLGRPGQQGLIPSHIISAWVGGNSIQANAFASVVGAFMYFATLTEIPILQGLIGNGMGKGPALALLLAGPALSLPNMIVIRSIMGTRRTLVFIVLVIVMSTISGVAYGRVG